jgi:Acetoacetate decarboxylase (ADC)
MILYTERDADLNLRPPYRMTGVEGLIATRRISARAAQQWIDETLNWRPAGTTERTRFSALPLAFNVFLRIEAMRSLDPQHSGWPAMRESELSVVLPVVESRPGELPDFSSLKFYPVMLCLDSSPAMISGREVFGFPKFLGSVDWNDRGGEARCEVAGRTGDPVTVRDARLMALQRTGNPLAQPPDEPLDSFSTGLARMAAEVLAGVSFVEDFTRDIWRELWGDLSESMLMTWLIEALTAMAGPFDFVFLKQFRDITDPRQACYRCVATSEIRFSGVTSPRFLGGDWELDVPPHRSSALLAKLGLESGPIGRPLRMDFDFDLSLGRKIWSS